MKKKIKLKDERKQHLAAEALCKNNQKIHVLFTEAVSLNTDFGCYVFTFLRTLFNSLFFIHVQGSNMKGLEDIMPKLAELLTLNDPQCIELQLVTLANIYPGLR